MWWSKAFLVVGVLTLGPAGCGFEPMYARPTGGGTTVIGTQLSTIRVNGIQDRKGQLLRNALVQRLSPLGEPARPSPTLEVTLSSAQENLAERSDGRASLGRMFVTATYRLFPMGAEQPAFSGNSRSVVSYRLLGPRYSSVAVERDAEERALSELAEDIGNQLGTYFSSGGANRSVTR